jgi:YvrJ-like protein
MPTFDQIITVVREFGFPVLVAGYVLYRIEPTLRELTTAVTQAVEILRLIAEKVLGIEPPKRS